MSTKVRLIPTWLPISKLNKKMLSNFGLHFYYSWGVNNSKGSISKTSQIFNIIFKLESDKCTANMQEIIAPQNEFWHRIINKKSKTLF